MKQESSLDCERRPKTYLDKVKKNYLEGSMLIRFYKWLKKLKARAE